MIIFWGMILSISVRETQLIWSASILYPIRDKSSPQVLQTVQSTQTPNIAKIHTFQRNFELWHQVCFEHSTRESSPSCISIYWSVILSISVRETHLIWSASILYPIRDKSSPKLLQSVHYARTVNIAKIHTFQREFELCHHTLFWAPVPQNHYQDRYVSFKVWFSRKEMEKLNWNEARRIYTLFEIRAVLNLRGLCSQLRPSI